MVECPLGHDQNDLPYVRVCVGLGFCENILYLGFYGLAAWEGWPGVPVPNYWSLAYLGDQRIIDLRKLLVCLCRGCFSTMAYRILHDEVLVSAS